MRVVDGRRGAARPAAAASRTAASVSDPLARYPSGCYRRVYRSIYRLTLVLSADPCVRQTEGLPTVLAGKVVRPAGRVRLSVYTLASEPTDL